MCQRRICGPMIISCGSDSCKQYYGSIQFLEAREDFLWSVDYDGRSPNNELETRAVLARLRWASDTPEGWVVM